MILKKMKLFGGLVALTLAASGCASNNLPTKSFTPYTVTMAYQGTEVTTLHNGEDQKIIYQPVDQPKTHNYQAILADLVTNNKFYHLR